MSKEIIAIDNSNMPIYLNLAHAYEAEFSSLTGKRPNDSGLFSPDTMPTRPYCGFLIYHDELPIGF